MAGESRQPQQAGEEQRRRSQMKTDAAAQQV